MGNQLSVIATIAAAVVLSSSSGNGNGSGSSIIAEAFVSPSGNGKRGFGIATNNRFLYLEGEGAIKLPTPAQQQNYQQQQQQEDTDKNEPSNLFHFKGRQDQKQNQGQNQNQSATRTATRTATATRTTDTNHEKLLAQYQSIRKQDNGDLQQTDEVDAETDSDTLHVQVHAQVHAQVQVHAHANDYVSDDQAAITKHQHQTQSVFHFIQQNVAANNVATAHTTASSIVHPIENIDIHNNIDNKIDIDIANVSLPDTKETPFEQESVDIFIDDSGRMHTSEQGRLQTASTATSVAAVDDDVAVKDFKQRSNTPAVTLVEQQPQNDAKKDQQQSQPQRQQRTRRRRFGNILAAAQPMLLARPGLETKTNRNNIYNAAMEEQDALQSTFLARPGLKTKRNHEGTPKPQPQRQAATTTRTTTTTTATTTTTTATIKKKNRQPMPESYTSLLETRRSEMESWGNNNVIVDNSASNDHDAHDEYNNNNNDILPPLTSILDNHAKQSSTRVGDVPIHDNHKQPSIAKPSPVKVVASLQYQHKYQMQSLKEAEAKANQSFEQEKAKSMQSLEETLGGRSLQEVLDAKIAPTWLVEMLDARALAKVDDDDEDNNEDQYYNPLLAPILNNQQHQQHHPPSSTTPQNRVFDWSLARKEAKSKRSLEDLLDGRSLEEVLEAKTAPTWLVEMLEARDVKIDEHRNNPLLTSILANLPRQQPKKSDSSNTPDHLLQNLRLALKEAKSTQSLEEILDIASLEEMLEATVPTPQSVRKDDDTIETIAATTTSTAAAAATTLRELLQTTKVNDDNDQHNLLVASILDNHRANKKPSFASPNTYLLAALRVTLDEEKSKLALSEILNGRSLEETLEAAKAAEQLQETMLSAKQTYYERKQTEAETTMILPENLLEKPMLSKQEKKPLSIVAKQKQPLKDPTSFYRKNMTPPEISSAFLYTFTPDRNIRQLVEKDTDDLDTLQFAVSRLAWGVVKGSTAAVVGVGAVGGVRDPEQAVQMAAQSTQSFVSSGTAFLALLWKSGQSLLEGAAENRKPTTTAASVLPQQQAKEGSELVEEHAETALLHHVVEEMIIEGDERSGAKTEAAKGVKLFISIDEEEQQPNKITEESARKVTEGHAALQMEDNNAENESLQVAVDATIVQEAEQNEQQQVKNPADELDHGETAGHAASLVEDNDAEDESLQAVVVDATTVQESEHHAEAETRALDVVRLLAFEPFR